MTEKPPPPRGRVFVVTAGDGTLFWCRVDRAGADSQPRWIFTDTRGHGHLGPVADRPLVEAELRELVKDWWAKKARGRAGQPNTPRMPD